MMSYINKPSLDEIKAMLNFIPATSDRNEWISVFHSVASAYPKNHEAFALCQSWARGYAGRNENVDSKHEFKEFFSEEHKATIGALIAKAKRNGYVKDLKSSKSFTSYTVAKCVENQEEKEEKTLFSEALKTSCSILQCLLINSENTEIINFHSSNYNSFKYYPQEVKAVLIAQSKYIKTHSSFEYADFLTWLELTKSEVTSTKIDELLDLCEFERINPTLLDNYNDLAVAYGKCIIASIEAQKLVSLTKGAIDGSAEDVVKKINSSLITLQGELDSTTEKSVSTPADALDLIKDYEELLQDPNRRAEVFIPFGHKALDEAVWGMPRKEVTLFSAFTGQGKTWFAVDLSNRLLEKNYKLGFVSAEMNDRAIWHRLFLNKQNIAAATSREYQLYAFNEFVANKRLEILAKRGVAIKDIENFVAKMYYSGGLDVLLIDYFQLIDLGYGSSLEKWERHKKVMERLVALAIKYDIAIFCLGQLTQNKAKKEPDMYDIAGSTQIVHDVALSIFMYEVDATTLIKVSKSRYQTAGTKFLVSKSTGSVFTLTAPMNQGYASASRKINLWS